MYIYIYREIRECLKLDPEHSKCFSFYKKVKKVAKLLISATEYEDKRDYTNCIDSALSILKLEPQIINVRFLAHQHLCKCYTSNQEPTQAIKNCHEALKIRKEAAVYCDRAEAYLAAEMFDDGKLYIYSYKYFNLCNACIRFSPKLLKKNFFT